RHREAERRKQDARPDDSRQRSVPMPRVRVTVVASRAAARRVVVGTHRGGVIISVRASVRTSVRTWVRGTVDVVLRARVAWPGVVGGTERQQPVRHEPK
ncbi:MAG TPA: hypothetical protein VG106_05680, partial [Vicinamibacterales bacterium]|nr:hypothetical protein [Vicinamibacterales bacterium]